MSMWAQRLLSLEQCHAEIDFDDLRRGVLEDPSGGWRRFVERYSRFVYTVALRLAGGEDREEIAQQAYAAVFERLSADRFKSLREFRGDSRFETYLFVAVRSAVVHQRRRTTRQRKLSDPYEDDQPPAEDALDFSASIGLAPDRVAELVSQSLARLEPREREILHQRFQQGLTLRRLAKLFDWKDTNAAAYELCRVLRKLDLLGRCRETLRWGEPEREVLRRHLQHWLRGS